MSRLSASQDVSCTNLHIVAALPSSVMNICALTSIKTASMTDAEGQNAHMLRTLSFFLIIP